MLNQLFYEDEKKVWLSGFNLLLLPIILNIPCGLFLKNMKLNGLKLVLMLSSILIQIAFSSLSLRLSAILFIVSFSMFYCIGPLAITCISVQLFPSDSLAFSLGINKLFSNLGAILSHQIIGWLQDINNNSYEYSLLFLHSIALILTITSAVLYLKLK